MQPDPLHREVSCLPGVQVRNTFGRLSGLVQFSDYYPLVVVQVNSDEVGKSQDN